MDRFEAARKLGLADADVLALEETDDGVRVSVKDGGDRLIAGDGQVYALTGHPATSQLRRWNSGDPDEYPTAGGPSTPAGMTPEQTAQAGDEGEKTPTGQTEAGDEVPDGNADAVLSWVGKDPARAQRALDAEEGREHKRSVLISKLRKLAE